jgi:hypothetical protein
MTRLELFSGATITGNLIFELPLVPGMMRIFTLDSTELAEEGLFVRVAV